MGLTITNQERLDDLLSYIQKNLTFNEEKHKYTIEDCDFDFESITEFLGKNDEDQKRVFESIGEERLNNYATQGTNIHNAIEHSLFYKKFIKGYEKHQKKARATLDALGVWSWVSEMPIYNKSLRLAGTVDILGVGGATLKIVDWKTSSSIVPKHRVQVGLYILMVQALWKHLFNEIIDVDGYVCYVFRDPNKDVIISKIKEEDLDKAKVKLQERKKEINNG